MALPGPDLTIYGLWALYARPRSEHVRREDLQAIARKVEQVEDEAAIPEPLRGFVRHLQVDIAEDDGIVLNADFFGQQPQSETSWESSPSGRGGAAVSSDPGRRRAPYFFPLPYNQEQARIIDTLENRGVAVVTGPPGTGKSHTIANIIAHYMATDRRVLVTAKTAEAISVVKEKLPESLGRLTIAVVHSDREGAKQLEDAISAMSRDARAVDRNEMRQTIQDLEARIIETENAADGIDARLGAIARANLEAIPYRGQDMLPMDLAETLRREREAHDWFVDRPRPGKLATLPDNTIEEIRELRRLLGRDLAYLGQGNLPSPEDLPGARELIEANKQAAQMHGQPIEDFTGAPMMVRDDAFAEDRGRALASELMELDRWLAECPPWARDLYCAEVALSLPGADEGRDDFAQLRAAIGWLQDFTRATDPLQPGVCEWPNTLPEAEQFWRAVADLAQGRQPIGFMASLFKRDLKAALAQVRVEGKAPAGPEDWSRVEETWRWRKAYRAFLERWPGAPALPDLPNALANPRDVRTALAAVLEWAREAEIRGIRAPKLADETRALFIYGLQSTKLFVTPIIPRSVGRCGQICRRRQSAIPPWMCSNARHSPAPVRSFIFSANSRRPSTARRSIRRTSWRPEMLSPSSSRGCRGGYPTSGASKRCSRTLAPPARPHGRPRLPIPIAARARCFLSHGARPGDGPRPWPRWRRSMRWRTLIPCGRPRRS